MTRADRRLLPVGRIAGHRGASGELTVRVFAGDASVWDGLQRVWLEEDADGRAVRVESSRSYRDRLVLKLHGVDDAGAAAALKGRRVLAPADALPAAARDALRAPLLVGLEVVDAERERSLGVVRDVLPTGGTDLLVVERLGAADEELLIPCAPEIVVDVDEARGRVRVRLPAGLLELNRPTKDARR